MKCSFHECNLVPREMPFPHLGCPEPGCTTVRSLKHGPKIYKRKVAKKMTDLPLGFFESAPYFAMRDRFNEHVTICPMCSESEKTKNADLLCRVGNEFVDRAVNLYMFGQLMGIYK